MGSESWTGNNHIRVVLDLTAGKLAVLRRVQLFHLKISISHLVLPDQHPALICIQLVFKLAH